MRILEGIKNIENFSGRTGLTIGNFEGFHRGHQSIINTLIEESGKRGLYTAVLTFKEHPLKVLQNREPEKLAVLSDKIFQFRDRGIDLLIFVDFSPEFANTRPLQFLRTLCNALAPKLICLGREFRFGRGNTGSIELMESVSGKLGYELITVDDILDDFLNEGIPISSTRIRDAIKSGDIERACRMLGRNYYVYVTADSENPYFIKPFMENLALPGRGYFRGELVQIGTGKREQSLLSISERGLELDGDYRLPQGTLYQFYFYERVEDRGAALRKNDFVIHGK